MKRPELIAALSLILFLCGIWVAPLQEPDEGRYADIARSMIRSGDWLAPKLNGVLYFEKPPLFFWLQAVSMKAMGASEAPARLPAAVAAALLMAVSFGLSRRLYGNSVGLMTAGIMIASPGLAFFFRAGIPDVLLAALVASAIGAIRGPCVDDRPPTLGERLLFWLACGLAFLCKGPVALVVPWTGLAFFTALTRKTAPIRRLVLDPVGLVLFVSVATPWYLAMEARHPGYLKIFFIDQNIGRLVDGAKFDRNEPFWYYAPVFVGVFAPWTLFLPEACARVWKALRSALPTSHARPQTELDRSRLFLSAFVIPALIVFSIAESRLAYYLLPLALPVSALLADAVVLEADGRPRRPGALSSRLYALAAASLVIGLVFCAYGWAGASRLLPSWLIGSLSTEKGALLSEALRRTAGPVGVWLLGLALASGISARLTRRARVESALIPLFVALIAFFCAAPWHARSLVGLNSGREIADIVKGEVSAEDEVILYQRYYRSIPFYLDRPVIIWNATFSEFGRAPTEAELRRYSLQKQDARVASLWNGTGHTVAIVCGVEDLAEFETAVGDARPRRLIGRVGRVRILENER